MSLAKMENQFEKLVRNFPATQLSLEERRESICRFAWPDLLKRNQVALSIFP